MKVAAVILAAGASRRMGTSKALLDYRGTTFVDSMVRAFAAGCDPLIVVVGTEENAIRNVIGETRVQFAVNPDPERGQLSSLQCGMRAVPEDAGAVAFCPVDLPGIRPETIHRLIEALDSPVHMLAIPRYHGRHGHPVIAVRSLIPEFLDLPVSAAAHDVIHAHRDHTRFVEVDDAATVRDVDTPDDYDRLRSGV